MMKVRFIIVLLLVLLTLLACKKQPTQPGTHENEGTLSNPVFLVVGSTHQGTVASFGTSFYKFVAAGTGSHTISLTNTQSDLSWDLYDDFNYSNTIDWCDNYGYAADEIASTVPLTNGTTYYLLVDEWDFVAGTFSLTITFP